LEKIENFEASVLTTALLKRLGVPVVIARASGSASRIQERILSLVGADRVILPEVKMIGELRIRERYNVNILEVKKISGEGKDTKIKRINYLPQAKDIIEKGDILLVIGKEEDIERIAKEG